MRERAQEDVFRREVDEAVRQDTLAYFFRNYGKLLIVLAILLVIGLGGWSYWHHQKTADAQQDAVDLTLAIDQLEAGNVSAAAEKAAPLTGSDIPAGYRVPAQFLAAAAALDAGDNAKAAQLFDAVAADGDNPQAMRDLATLRAVGAQYDTMQPQQVVDRLKPLAIPGKPFFASAGELVGMAYIEQDKRDIAGPLFAEIAKDEEAPETIRSRARQLAGLLGVDAVEDPEEMAAMVARGGARPTTAR